jgi:hypothetical protein
MMATNRTPTVQGWAWYAYRHGLGTAADPGSPFDKLAARPASVRLACPVRSAEGIGNRFPEDRAPGFLVVTDRPTAPEVDETWTVEPAELADGFRAGSKARLVRVVTVSNGRWGPVQECIFALGQAGPSAPVLGPVMV